MLLFIIIYLETDLNFGFTIRWACRTKIKIAQSSIWQKKQKKIGQFAAWAWKMQASGMINIQNVQELIDNKRIKHT